MLGLRIPTRAIGFVLGAGVGCASLAPPKASPTSQDSTQGKPRQTTQTPTTGPIASTSPGRTEPAKLVARCCTVACYPGGTLGHVCDLDTLRQRLLHEAAEKHLELGEISCQETSEACNVTCESPPGVRLSCDAPAGAAAMR